MKTFTASRQIGIDAGHRVTQHKSKCANVHGHRYTITATVEGELIEIGSSSGMVEDFGDLKECMMKAIDAPCDHGMILWIGDTLAERFAFCTEDGKLYYESLYADEVKLYLADIGPLVQNRGYALVKSAVGKLYLVNFVPTAENLAAHWFKCLQVALKSSGLRARLLSIRVDETPNAFAIYSE